MHILHFPAADILNSASRLKTRSLLAAYLFKRGVLSLGKAAELAELNLGAFITYLDDLEIPVVDYDKDELNAEFKVAKKLKKDQ